MIREYNNMNKRIKVLILAFCVLIFDIIAISTALYIRATKPEQTEQTEATEEAKGVDSADETEQVEESKSIEEKQAVTNVEKDKNMEESEKSKTVEKTDHVQVYIKPYPYIQHIQSTPITKARA